MNWVQLLAFRTFPRLGWTVSPAAQFFVSAVVPFLYTVDPMASWVPGKRIYALSRAGSLALLAMKSFGSSGAVPLGGANDGVVPVALGMSAVAGSDEVGLFA